MSLLYPRRFPTTRWSLVSKAARSGDEPGEALRELCESYWYPVYAFIRRTEPAPDAAADLTQAFFTFLIETRALRRADEARGRFRSFLLGSVRHFLSNERERERALKRGGSVLHLPIDRVCEAGGQTEASERGTPEQEFARNWALALVERSLNELRAELAAEGRTQDFERYGWLLCDMPSPGDYEHLAETTGLTRGAVRVVIHRLRTRFRGIVRREIERLGGRNATDVDAEIRFLIDAVSR